MGQAHLPSETKVAVVSSRSTGFWGVQQFPCFFSSYPEAKPTVMQFDRCSTGVFFACSELGLELQVLLDTWVRTLKPPALCCTSGEKEAHASPWQSTRKRAAAQSCSCSSSSSSSHFTPLPSLPWRPWQAPLAGHSQPQLGGEGGVLSQLSH